MPSKLLTPAISVMNRLTYLYKFSLNTIMFLVPLLWLAYMQLSDISSRNASPLRQLGGMDALQQSLELIELAAIFVT